MNKTLKYMMRKDMKQLLWITGLTATATVAMVGVLLLLASCSQEEDSGTSGSKVCIPLTVTAVSMTADGAKPATRVVPVPVTEGKLGVGVRAGNGYTAQTGLVYTGTAGAWTCPTSVVLSKDPISLYAYYPQDGYSIDGSGNVALTTQVYAADKDLGYALSGGENVCSAHPYAGFVLNHAYARLKVDIIFSPLFEDATTLDAVTLDATGFSSTGTLNVGTGAYISGATQPKLEWLPAKTLVEIDRKFNSDMLLAPSPAMTGAKLTVTVSGSNWAADLSSALTRLEAGKSYRIKVIMGAALIIDKVEVEEWSNGTSQNGEMQFE